MKSEQAIDIGLSRIKIPVPTSKLVTIHSAADLVNDPDFSEVAWDHILSHIQAADLESEIIELLCIPLLCRSASVVTAISLRKAIQKPSILSDIFIQYFSKQEAMLDTWTHSHAPEVNAIFVGESELDELNNPRVIPKICFTRFSELERVSGFPFLKQWALELRGLRSALGEIDDGRWEYFIDGDREARTGQFVTKQSQVMRSAYLRTLAGACDFWNLPRERAQKEALFATPADPALLAMRPTMSPQWFRDAISSAPSSEKEWHSLAEKVIQFGSDSEPNGVLVHFNSTICSSTVRESELEIISCLIRGTQLTAESAFKHHKSLVGDIELPRDGNFRIVIEPPLDAQSGEQPEEGFAPALLPVVTRHFGYLHSDLLKRMPYLPAIYCGRTPLLAAARAGGMEIELGKTRIGSLNYWNWNWRPTRNIDVGQGCGVCTVVNRLYERTLFDLNGFRMAYFWRARSLAREKEYQSWEKDTIFGELEFR